VQVFGDTHGNVVHLFERDCSLQRRHQKVIEEAPAPGMDEATREAICAAAVRAAKAVDYVGAGTIEFIADASDGLSAERIFFMEMNTRLQVEHPVTEEITGVDLVEWQLRVASGEPLPKRQNELSINGWAMEARLYAEDPAKGFLPSTGELELLYLPDRVRGETGVEEGDVISPHYDPMIAKLVAAASDRDTARSELSRACAETVCGPVRTNAWFLKRLLDHELFAIGAVTTDFIAQHETELTAPPEPSAMLLQEVAERLIFDGWTETSQWRARSLDRERGLLGFRLNRALNTDVVVYRDGAVERVAFDMNLYDSAESYEVSAGSILAQSDALYFEGGAQFAFARSPDVAQGAGQADGAILAPMPGKVIAVDVAQGETVAEGQRLLVLEAMKMEHALTAPFAGTVAELTVTQGQQVEVEALLVRVEREAD